MEGPFATWQGKAPPCVMGNRRRVVECVSVRIDRSLFANVPQYPFLLEPGDVPDFPEQRVDVCQSRTDQLVVREIRNQLAGPLPGIPDPVPELGTSNHARGPTREKE